ncbi:transcription factor bHLH168 [Coffea arabica]|uniref:Transcription factor bHLH168 n=1 Tax=Coffea arabica TaxID=13443 RepID=A0A6P6V8S3_COFAR
MQAPVTSNPKKKKKRHCTVKGLKMQPEGVSCKIGRSVKGKLRRLHFKNLYSRLASLLPPLASQEKLTLPALVEQSFVYVKDLKKRIDELNAKKEELKEDLVLPAIEMSEKGPILEVNLVTSLKKGFTLHEVISILEEEGAQVLSANYSTSKNRIYYTISSQAYSSRIGIETSRVYQRLKTLSAAGFASPALGGTLCPLQFEG